MKCAFSLLPGCVLILNLTFLDAAAQSGSPDMTFGAVLPEAFAPVVYDLDSNANAIYLFDHGEVSFDARYSTYGFSIVYERHARIRILNKNGLGLATMGLSTSHHKGYDAYIDDLRGATYNLQDGKVVVTKLDKSNIFKDKNGFYNIEKLAFPDVREGSIIEYSYRVVYPGFGYIPDWEFQQSYPVLWSEYEVTVPALYDYFVKTQGHRLFTVDTVLFSSASFAVNLSGFRPATWSGRTIHHIWALQDATAMEKKEPYTTTLRNHVQKVQFQLSALRYDGYEKDYMESWPKLTEQLLKNTMFGESLDDRNHWMDDELKKIVPAQDRSLPAAQKIFSYVRDQYSFTDQEGIYRSQTIRKTWDEKKGNVADLNLLLTAIYRHMGFEASPVILSTRSHGFPLEQFPLLNDYNYVVTRVQVEGRYYLLDASRPVDGFGQLPESCYNGMARAMDSSHDVIPIVPDSVTERRRTQVMLYNDSAGALSGDYSRVDGVFESMEMRNRMKREKPEDFFENLRKTMAEHKQMTEYGFDSLAIPEQPLGWHYSMTYRFAQKTIYFNPIMHERLNNNPLENPERHYPVEMPYHIDNSYILHMDVPKGYAIEQLPKSIRYLLQDGSGVFEYQVQSDGKSIDFQTRLQLKRSNYSIEEYPDLRSLYALIVQKEKEPIIFTKIN
jgi:Domain of Unknown Function with PDB structure (DUF3858)/Domain of Unknown Function with PDB structure (DUF3857)/Transglutaminase-like superfamily